jgi:Mce-associated membrane protein
VTVLVEETEAAPVVEEATPDDLAPWHIRAVALAVDVLPGVVVVATTAAVCSAVPLRSAWWWICVFVLASVILLTVANRVVLPTTIGWSLGRALMGIAVVRPDGTSVGVGRMLSREFAHLLDSISVFVGWLWPLWDARRRTFADLLLHTEVRCLRPDLRPAGMQRLTATVISAAALLCLFDAGMSVLVIVQPAWASTQTRDTIKVQGPKIVTEMLTYDPKSLQQEFAHARSLTTDRYRPQLIAQQDSVQKGHPVVNEYWVTNSAVLSAAPRGATMLLFMQGHRGGGDEERFITATVRVSFVKAKDGRWLVDDLDVVTKPKPAKGKK